MKNTNNPKSITCRIVNTGILMHINTIDEISFPGYFKIDACNVTPADGLPDGIDGTCLSAYLEVSDTNHNTDNLNRAAIGQTLFYTNAVGINAAYYRSGINKDGMVEWSTWVDLGAATTTDIQDHTITAQKLSRDVLTKIQESANGAWWSSGPNAVTLNINKNDGTVGWQTLPAATTEKAGVMTSQDRKTIDGIDAAIAEGEKRALRRLFIAAGALYNDTGTDITKTAPWGETVTHKAGHYYLNGLGDITEEQMANIYNAGHFEMKNDTIVDKYMLNSCIRTILPAYSVYNESYNTISFERSFYGCTAIEVMCFAQPAIHSLIRCKNLKQAFSGLNVLRIIINPLEISQIVRNKELEAIFNNCNELKLVYLKSLSASINLSSNAKISSESIMYMISNAAPTTAITITLHADAYARLAEDADIVAALEAQPLISLVSA